MVINMIILSKTFPGFMRVCDECGTLLSYAAKDMYEKKYIYCSVCKHKNEVPEIVEAQLIEVKKNGNIKENENANG